MKSIILNDIQLNSELTFLVIDDQDLVREQVIDQLKEIGVASSIIEASSFEEAVEKLNSDIDFIICDWNLNEISGYDFLIHVREKASLKDVPFLMLTANDDISTIMAATKKGVSEYLIKPWEYDELIEKIAYAWLKHYPESKITS